MIQENQEDLQKTVTHTLISFIRKYADLGHTSNALKREMEVRHRTKGGKNQSV